MKMTTPEKSKIKVGDILVGRRSGQLYDVVGYEMTRWPGHGIYTLVSRETKATRTIADFATYLKFEIHEQK